MSWRAGFVAIIGLPNVGKSTLLNQLIGEKLSIVTPKPQTTRRRVQGFLTMAPTQIIFVDAPGLVRAEGGLNQYLAEEAQAVVRDVDALIAVVSLDLDSPEKVERTLRVAKNSGKPWMVYVAKTDLPLVKRMDQITAWLDKDKIPWLKGSIQSTSEELRASITERVSAWLPVSAGPLYDQELFTTHSTKEIAAEYIREAAFLNLQKEIPYNLAVQILRYEEWPRIHRIHAEILVAKDNHKKIVVGHRGKNIKTIGMQARRSIEDMVNCQVFLDLSVKLKEDWMNQPRSMRELGYSVAGTT